MLYKFSMVILLCIMISACIDDADNINEQSNTENDQGNTEGNKSNSNRLNTELSSTIAGRITLSSILSSTGDESTEQTNADNHQNGGVNTFSEKGLYITPNEVNSTISSSVRLSNALEKGSQKISSKISPAEVETDEIMLASPLINKKHIPIDANGNFTVKVPAGQGYSLMYLDPNSKRAIRLDNINLNPNETLQQELTESIITSTTNVRFRIIDASSSQPIAGRAYLTRMDLSLNTNPNTGDGNFINIPIGDYSIVVSASGYATRNIRFTIGADPMNLGNIELQAGRGQVIGQISVLGLSNLANVPVYARSNDGSVHTTLTNASGIYRFVDLPTDDNYSFIFYANNLLAHKIDNITVREGVTTTVDEVTLNFKSNLNGSIAGHVRFQERNDQNQQAGIIVSIEGTDKETISSRDGAFVINDIAPGEYVINFTDSNHVPQTVMATVVGASATDLGLTVLDSLYGGLVGQIVSNDNLPLADAMITVGTTGLSSQTDSNGEFEFNQLPVGTHQLSVSKSGFRSTTQAISIIANEVEDLSLHPIKLPAFILKGTISLGEDLLDNSGVVISLSGSNQSVQSNENGEFIFYGVMPGNYQLQLSRAGYQNLNLSMTIPDSATNYTVPYTIELNQVYGMLSGVAQKQFSSDHSGIVVSIPETNYTTITDAFGSWQMSLIEGNYTTGLQYTANDFTTQTKSTEFAIEGNSILRKQPILLIRTEPNQFIGNVSLGEGIEDQSGVLLTLGNTGLTTQSDAQGHFVFSDVIPNSYLLILTKAGYQNSSVNVIIPANAPTYVLPYTIDMTQIYGTLSGVVRKQYATDHSGTLISMSGTSYTTVTDAAGSWRISLPEGEYTDGLQFTSTGYTSLTDSNALTIVAETLTQKDTATLTKLTGSVSGIAKDNADNTLAGVTITDTISGVNTVSLSDGSFTLSDVVTGTLSLQVSLAGYVSGSVTVEVSAGQTTELEAAVALTPYQFSGTISLGSELSDHSGVVVILDGANVTTLTNTSGQFSFKGIVPSNYQLQLSKTGFQNKAISITVPNNTAAYTLSYTIDMTQIYGTLSGVVRKQYATDHSGTLISMSGTSYTTVTDAAGSWRISLPEGEYTDGLQFTSTGYTSLTDSNALTIVAETLTQKDTATLTKLTGSVSGIVKDNTGNTLVGATITDTISGVNTVSLSDGSFTLSDVVTGTLSLQVSLAGYVSDSVTIEVSAGQTTELEAAVALTPYQFSGTVSLGSELSDHSGVVVSLDGTGKAGQTDSDGKFNFFGLAPGVYQLSASKSGYVTYTTSVSTLGDQMASELGFVINMQPLQGTIKGVVTLQNQLDHAGILVTLNGTTLTALTNSNGAWAFNVPIGNYSQGATYSKSLYGSNTYSNTITVTENGENVLLPVTLIQESAALNLNVTAINNCSQININLAGQSGNAIGYSNTLSPDNAGNIEIASLPLGTYQITYSCVNAGWETIINTFTLDSSTIQVTLNDVVLRQSYAVINNGDTYTNNTTLSVEIGSTNAVQMQLIEGSNDTGAIAFQSPYSYTASPGNGTKTITINLKDADGVNLPAVQDSIIVDTTIAISSFDATGANTKGQTLHFRLDAGETGGHAVATVTGLVENIELYDNGLLGDNTANDGIYEIDYPIQTSNDISTQATVVFTDKAGNIANATSASTVAIATAAEISNVQTSSDMIEQRLSVSFNTNELGTSQIAYGDSFATLTNLMDISTTLTNNHTIDLSDISTDKETFFELRVTDQGRNLSTYQGKSRLAPPAPSSVIAVPGDSEIGIAWKIATGNYNLAGYDIYRSEDNATFLKANSALINQPFYIDTLAINDTTYYYKVKAVDTDGNESDESEVANTTASLTKAGPTVISDAIINTSTVWLNSKSPYVVNNSILIESGSMLYISPGVEAKFEENTYLKVEGGLVAKGDSTNHIVFTSNSTTQNMSDWEGIWFNSSDTFDTKSYTVESCCGRQQAISFGIATLLDNSSDYVNGSILDYVEIYYASSGVNIQETGLYIQNSLFQYNKHAIKLSTKSHFNTIKNNNIENNTNAIYTHNATNSMAYFYHNTVSNNIIKNNTNFGVSFGKYNIDSDYNIVNNNTINFNGTGIDFSDTNSGSPSENIVSNNIITNNTNTGISIGGSNNLIDSNSISANVNGIVTYHSRNLNLYVNNEIFNNSNKGIYFYGQSYGHIVKNNNIYQNSGYAIYIGQQGSYVPKNLDIRFNHIQNNGGGVFIEGPTYQDYSGDSKYFIFNSVYNNSGDLVNVEAKQSFFSGNLNYQFNYWGNATTTEMNNSGSRTNISTITDFYDDFEITRVDYSNWLTSPPSQIGPRTTSQETLDSSTVSIEDAAASTAALTVNLIFTTSTATQMWVSNDPNFTSGAWESFQTVKAWDLADPGSGNIANVFVKFKDAAANESVILFDDITYSP